MRRPFMYQRSKQNESKKNQKKGEEKWEFMKNCRQED